MCADRDICVADTDKAHQRNAALHLLIFFMSGAYSAGINTETAVKLWYDVHKTIRKSFSDVCLLHV